MSDKTPLASEASHYYAKDGTPVYEVPRARGDGMRPTTLADARKLDLVPSTTKVIYDCYSSPGLKKYFKQQIVYACLTLPRTQGESEDDFAERAIKDAEEHARKARETGTELHAAIEEWIQNKISSPDKIYIPSLDHSKWGKHIGKLFQTLNQYGIDLFKGKPEHSFASPLGYGGKIDWHNDEVLIDFKTKAKVKDVKQVAYPEHCWQLSAYAQGIGNTHCLPTRLLNVFIGIDDCEVRIHEWSKEDSYKAFDCFYHLLKFWQIKNSFGDKL